MSEAELDKEKIQFFKDWYEADTEARKKAMSRPKKTATLMELLTHSYGSKRKRRVDFY